MFGVVAVEVFVTYSRLPARSLWRVSGTGLEGGASRVFVFLSYPVGLVAIAILLLALDRIRTRRLRALALLGMLCCIAGLAFVRTSNWDARPVNAIGAVGVAIALLLTVVARDAWNAPAAPRTWRHRGWLAVTLAAVMFVIAVPAMAADLGYYLDRVPLLGSLYQTGAIRHEPGIVGAHDAVHHGHHEGMDGVLFVWSALLLWRYLPSFRSPRLRAIFGGWLAFLVCYGAAVALGDFWLEQIAKRGWTSWTFDVSYPELSSSWGLLVAATAALWLVAVRPSARNRADDRV